MVNAPRDRYDIAGEEDELVVAEGLELLEEGEGGDGEKRGTGLLRRGDRTYGCLVAVHIDNLLEGGVVGVVDGGREITEGPVESM